VAISIHWHQNSTGTTVPTFKLALVPFLTTGTRIESAPRCHGVKIILGTGALFSQFWHRCQISPWHQCPLQHMLAQVPNFTVDGAAAFFGTLVPQVVPTPGYSPAALYIMPTTVR